MEDVLRSLEARMASLEAKVTALDVRLKTVERNSTLEARVRAIEQDLARKTCQVSPIATWGILAAGFSQFLLGLPAWFATHFAPRLGSRLCDMASAAPAPSPRLGPERVLDTEPPSLKDLGSEGQELSNQAAIRALHLEACRRGVDSYVDPASGFDVFTSEHLRTRPCCGSGCRHCPWGHRNVPSKRQLSSTAPKSTLYTRKGDAGWTSLYNEQCVLKSDQVYEAIGAIDELNSALGLARAYLQGGPVQDLPQQLETVQGWLLDVGSSLCTPRDGTRQERKLKKTRGVTPEVVAELEIWVDIADAQVRKLQNFILPHGSLGSGALHLARSICRRAERCTWPRIIAGSADAVIGIFLNRLSDYLFVAARLDAQASGIQEQQYGVEFKVDRWQRQIKTAG